MCTLLCYCLFKIGRKAMIRNRHNYLTPSVLRHQRERRTHLKYGHHNQNTTSRKPKGQFYIYKKWPNGFPKQKLHQDKHAKTHNDRYSNPLHKHRIRTVRKILLWVAGVLVNRFYVATTPALSSAVVYTRHLFSPRERFWTHQCNNSENIKVKRKQRWNNDENSTAKITEMLKQKKQTNKKPPKNSSTPVGLTRVRVSPTDLHKCLYAGAVIVWGPTRWCATKEGSKGINPWLGKLPCMQSVVLHLSCTQYLCIEERFYEIQCQNHCKHIFFWIYILSHHPIQVPIDLVAEAI